MVCIRAEFRLNVEKTGRSATMPVLTLAIPIRRRDNLIAKVGRLNNTKPNLAVYF